VGGIEKIFTHGYCLQIQVPISTSWIGIILGESVDKELLAQLPGELNLKPRPTEVQGNHLASQFAANYTQGGKKKGSRS
jgi:hypothetical protein